MPRSAVALLAAAFVTGPGCGPPTDPPTAPRVPLTVAVTKAGKPDVPVPGERVELVLTSVADGGRYTLPAGGEPGAYAARNGVPPGKYTVEMTVDNPGGKPGMPKTLHFPSEVEVDPAKPAVSLDAPAGR